MSLCRNTQSNNAKVEHTSDTHSSGAVHLQSVKLDTEPCDDDVVHVQHIANILLTDNYTAQ